MPVRYLFVFAVFDSGLPNHGFSDHRGPEGKTFNSLARVGQAVTVVLTAAFRTIQSTHPLTSGETKSLDGKLVNHGHRADSTAALPLSAPCAHGAQRHYGGRAARGAGLREQTLHRSLGHKQSTPPARARGEGGKPSRQRTCSLGPFAACRCAMLFIAFSRGGQPPSHTWRVMAAEGTRHVPPHLRPLNMASYDFSLGQRPCLEPQGCPPPRATLCWHQGHS